MKRAPAWIGNLLVVLILVAVVVLVTGAAMINAEYIYGDWRCAFAHCVKVLP